MRQLRLGAFGGCPAIPPGWATVSCTRLRSGLHGPDEDLVHLVFDCRDPRVTAARTARSTLRLGLRVQAQARWASSSTSQRSIVRVLPTRMTPWAVLDLAGQLRGTAVGTNGFWGHHSSGELRPTSLNAGTQWRPTCWAAECTRAFSHGGCACLRRLLSTCCSACKFACLSRTLCEGFAAGLNVRVRAAAPAGHRSVLA